MPAAELELPAHPRYVGIARRFARETLTAWQIEALVPAAELVVSELVSNGVLHARSPLVLRLCTEDDTLLVEVTDDSPTGPERRHHDENATTGRGLAMVAALSGGDWGSRSSRDGKIVWARLHPDRLTDDGLLSAPSEDPSPAGRSPLDDSRGRRSSSGPRSRAA